MGYSFTIGKIEQNSKYYGDYFAELIAEGKSTIEAQTLATQYSMCVKSEHLDNAPAFGEITDYTNEREPSYTAWAMVCEVANLEDLFYGKDGVLKNHPGIFQIKKEWLDTLNARIKRFKMQYKKCVASYDENANNFEVKVYSLEGRGNVPVNFMLCRIEWLDFWCNYAFEKYGVDAYFQNS